MVSKDTSPSYYFATRAPESVSLLFLRILQKQDPAARYEPRAKGVQHWLICPVPYRAKERKNGLEMGKLAIIPSSRLHGSSCFAVIHSPCQQVVV